MNLGHISFHFCPLCQNCYTIVFFIYVVRCDMPCTRIMLGFTLYNFDNKYPFIVIVIVIVIILLIISLAPYLSRHIPLPESSLAISLDLPQSLSRFLLIFLIWPLTISPAISFTCFLTWSLAVSVMISLRLNFAVSLAWPLSYLSISLFLAISHDVFQSIPILSCDLLWAPSITLSISLSLSCSILKSLSSISCSCMHNLCLVIILSHARSLLWSMIFIVWLLLCDLSAFLAISLS